MRRSLLIGLVVVAGVVAAPRVARAGAWYYTWSCSGQCAPGQLAISGVEGPFGSEDECNSVRSHDSRADYFVAEGNLGGLDFCRESEGPPAVSGDGSSSGGGSHGPAPVLARLIVALVAGPSYRVQDPQGLEPSTGGTGGIEVAMHLGGHPIFGLEAGVGLHYTEVTAPHYGADAKPMMFVPLTMGFTSTPAIVRGERTEVRLDLGLDGGVLFRVGCSDCDADMLPELGWIAELRAGLDTYWGAQKNGGVGLDAVFMFGSEGSVSDPVSPSAVAILPPTVLFRLSFIARNDRGVDW